MKEGLRRLGVVVALFGATAAPPTAAGQDSATAFVHVAVIPMDRERVLYDQTVLVAGNRISALGPANRVVVPARARRIDGRGKYLIPGLADMHAHIARQRGDTLTIADVLFAFLANGVTTIRDMHSGNRHSAESGYGNNNPDSYRFALRRRIAAGALLGPQLYTAGDPDLSSPAAAAQSVAELKADGHDFVKVAFYSGELRRTPALYDSILTAAARVGLRVVGHVPPNLSVRRILADRWASIEHLLGYRADVLLGSTDESFGDGSLLVSLNRVYADTAFWMKPGYRLDGAKLRELAEATRRAGVWNCPTLNSNQNVYDRMVRAFQAKPESERPTGLSLEVLARYLVFDREIVKALQDASAGLLLGSDAVIDDPGPSGFVVHQELALLVAAGLTPYQALVAGTRNVAEFLGTLDSSGTVAVGKRADLVLLSGNPLNDIRYTAGPTGVMAQGRWLSRTEIDQRLDAMSSQRNVYAASSYERRFYDAVSQARQQYWRH